MGGLAQAASPATKRRVMSTVGGVDDAVAQRRLLADDLGALRDDIVPLRAAVSGERTNFTRLDQARGPRTGGRRALSVMGKLERAEAVELVKCEPS